MATLLELLSNLSEDQMREGESVTVVDSAGREATITFGPAQRPAFDPPEMVAWGIPAPHDGGHWHQHVTP